MNVLSAYWSTIDETIKSKPGEVLKVKICDLHHLTEFKGILIDEDTEPEFAGVYMDKDYSLEHMDVHIPVMEDGIVIVSALNYALSGFPLERYILTDEDGVQKNIDILVIDIPKKIWKKLPWMVKEIAYTFATNFPDLTIISAIPKNFKESVEIPNIFKRK